MLLPNTLHVFYNCFIYIRLCLSAVQNTERGGAKNVQMCGFIVAFCGAAFFGCVVCVSDFAADYRDGLNRGNLLTNDESVSAGGSHSFFGCL